MYCQEGMNCLDEVATKILKHDFKITNKDRISGIAMIKLVGA